MPELGSFSGLIVGRLLAVGVMILGAQNTGSIDIAFLGWDSSIALIVLILGVLLIGVLHDALFGLIYRSRRRQTLSERDQLPRLGKPGYTS